MIIDQLPELTNTFDTDEIPIERGTNTYKTKISTFFSGLRDAITNGLALKVNKAGDTMTASLRFKSETLENNVAPSSSTSGSGFYFDDKNGVLIGHLVPYFTSGGNQSFLIQADRYVSGVAKNNYFLLGLDGSGNPVVTVSSPAAWRKALGLGNSSGAFPITVAQGGTGQTAVSTESTIGDIITAATGYTITEAVYCKWGKVGQFRMKIKKTTVETLSSLTAIATLKTGYRPQMHASATSPQSAITRCYVNSTGVIYAMGSFSANTEYSVFSTFIEA